MSSAADMTERHQRQLARLGELAMGLAEQAAADAANADTPEQRVEAIAAFHRAARAARQSMALEARLVRDAQRAGRGAEAHDARTRERRIGEHRKRLAQPVERAIWDEYEGDEALALAYDLEDLLDEAVLDDDFLAADPDTQIARLCEALRLSAPRADEDREASDEAPAPARGHHPMPEAERHHWSLDPADSG